MKRVPFNIIQAAKRFDAEGLIVSRCLCRYDDEYGNTHFHVDDDLYYQAKIALFRAIDNFQFKKPPDDFMP